MPSMSYSEELISAYPDAKVILTVHDNEDAWHESVTNTIWTGYYLFGFPKSTLQLLIQKITSRPEACRTLQYCYEYSIKEELTTRGEREYLEDNAKVRSLVPKERLLEFNVKLG
jgi:hypothetical protein